MMERTLQLHIFSAAASSANKEILKETAEPLLLLIRMGPHKRLVGWSELTCSAADCSIYCQNVAILMRRDSL
jgi:hypothetical protein